MTKHLGTSSRFLTQLQTIDGRFFYGELTNPTPEGQFLHPRTVLRVNPDSLVTVSDVIITPIGRKFLCAQIGEDFGGSIQTSIQFELFEMTDNLEWFKPSTVVDPVTNLQKSSSFVSQGNIDCSEEQISDQVGGDFNVDSKMFRIITGSLLTLDDKLGTYIVRKVTNSLGIIIAEVR